MSQPGGPQDERNAEEEAIPQAAPLRGWVLWLLALVLLLDVAGTLWLCDAAEEGDVPRGLLVLAVLVNVSLLVLAVAGAWALSRDRPRGY